MSDKEMQDPVTTENLELATLGGGCFWCLEPVFEDLAGVEKVVVGYAGGDVADPSYEAVCRGTTGHAEVVQVSFDPRTISFTEILEVFFSVHNPTTPNRQGADVGPQYRSVIFYYSEAQRSAADEVIERIETADVWEAPVVTERTPLSIFYPGEDYHQQYFRKNPNQGYCQAVIRPKVAKFRSEHAARLKSA